MLIGGPQDSTNRRGYRIDMTGIALCMLLTLAVGGSGKPDLKEVYVPMGQIYLSQGEAQKALDAAAKFLELQPGDASGLVLSYQANEDLGNAEAATQILDQLKASSPEVLTRTFMKSGTEDFNANRTQAAIESFETVLDSAPDHPQAHYMLGLAYAGSDAAKAKSLLARFIELAPDDPEVATAKAMIAAL